MRIPMFAGGTIPDFDTLSDDQERFHETKPKSYREKPMTVVGVKRNIGEHDSLRIGNLVRRGVQGLDNIDIDRVTVFSPHGATILSPDEARLAYERYHFTGIGIRSLKRYNHILKETIHLANNERPLMFVQLGEIAIFGAPEDQEGSRYVGAVLEGEELEQLKAERQTFLHTVIPEDDSSLYHMLNDDYVHHLSLLKTTSEATAQRAAESLQYTEIEGTWVTLMPAIPIKRDFTLNRTD